LTTRIVVAAQSVSGGAPGEVNPGLVPLYTVYGNPLTDRSTQADDPTFLAPIDSWVGATDAQILAGNQHPFATFYRYFPKAKRKSSLALPKIFSNGAPLVRGTPPNGMAFPDGRDAAGNPIPSMVVSSADYVLSAANAGFEIVRADRGVTRFSVPGAIALDVVLASDQSHPARILAWGGFQSSYEEGRFQVYALDPVMQNVGIVMDLNEEPVLLGFRTLNRPPEEVGVMGDLGLFDAVIESSGRRAILTFPKNDASRVNAYDVDDFTRRLTGSPLFGSLLAVAEPRGLPLDAPQTAGSSTLIVLENDNSMSFLGVSSDAGWNLVRGALANDITAPTPLPGPPAQPPSTRPTIDGFSPAGGTPGTGVNINGTDLDTVTAVQFNGLNAVFNLVNPTLITATVPAGATSGMISLLARDGSRINSAQGFTVTPVAPNAPSNLTATVVGLQIQLRWQDNNAGQTGFKVERKVTTGTYQLLGTVERGVMSFVDTGVTPATLYTYLVKAFTAAAESTPSNEAIATVPPLVPQVKLSASPTQLSVIAGQSIRCAITISRTNLTAPVNLLLGALPVGLGPVFSANPASGDSSVLTFNASADASPGTYNVSISATAPGIEIAPITLTLKVGAPPPSITGFTPASGPANTTVMIFGSNFAGATEVRFNGALATFTLASPRSISVFVPFFDATGPPTSFTITPPRKEGKEKESKEKEKEGKEASKDIVDKNRLKDNKDRQDGEGFSIETSFQAAGVVPPASARLAGADSDYPKRAVAPWQHFIGRALRPTLNQGLFDAESNLSNGGSGRMPLP
jgi:hypothetical protein